MRSLFTRTGTAVIAATALFAVMAMPSTANAFTFRTHDLTATSTGGPEAVQKVAITRSEARQARRDVARAVRDDCRLNNTGRDRGRCFRETYRGMRTQARDEAREA